MPRKKKNNDLRWVAIELTARCNLRCVHCRISSADAGAELSADEIRRLLDDVAKIGNPTIVLSGGEPLLRSDVFSIAADAAEKGFRVGIATNGTLVTPAVAHLIKDAGIKIAALSLDGPDAKTHDAFRGADGAFDAAVRAAGILKKTGIPFIINSSFTKKNAALAPETCKLARSLGAKAWYMFAVVPAGRAASGAAELLDASECDRMLRWHYEAEKAETEMLMRPTCAPHYYRIAKELDAKTGTPLERKTLKLSPGGSKGCVAAEHICFVTCAGEVQPCSYLPLSAGNVRKIPFNEIWENSELFRSLRDPERHSAGCGPCEYFSVCGGCRARALAYKGDIFAKDPLCLHAPGKRIAKGSRCK
jgi:radical SAM protein with 4Fe4S-binding SPASM domain